MRARKEKAGRSKAKTRGGFGSFSRAFNQNVPSDQVTIRKLVEPVVIIQDDLDSFGGFDFRLAILTQGGNFAALFQQYRIDMVELTFRPMYRANPVSATPSLIPLIYVAPDINDGSSWSSISSACAADRVAQYDDSESFRLSLTPRVATDVYAGAFGSFAMPNDRPWIDTDSPAVRHYGVKYAVTGAGIGATALQAWNVSIRYTVTLRKSR